MREITMVERRYAASTKIRDMLEEAGFKLASSIRGRGSIGTVFYDTWVCKADTVIVARIIIEDQLQGLDVFLPAVKGPRFEGTFEVLESFLNYEEGNGNDNEQGTTGGAEGEGGGEPA